MAYRSNQAFMLPGRRFISVGQLISDSDPAAPFMVEHGLVVEVEEYIRGVEAATANPGEARLVSPPRKKTAAKKKPAAKKGAK